MKIAVVAMVRNEGDIIEAFVRYHARIADVLLVANHLSLDATPDILRALQAEGLPLEVEEETSPGHVQYEVINRLAVRAVAEFDVDWVIALDGDEFITSSGARSVRRVLETSPTDEALLMGWRTYIPHPSDDAGRENPIQRIRHHLVEEVSDSLKVAVPRGLVEAPELVIEQGNHGLVDLRRGKRARQQRNIDDLQIAHYPVRSLDQLKGRMLVAWLSSRARGSYHESEDWHRKVMFDRFSGNEILDDSDLPELALQYFVREKDRDKRAFSADALVDARLEVPGGAFDLKHPTGARVLPITLLAKTAEQIAISHSQLARECERLQRLLGGEAPAPRPARKRRWFFFG